MGDAAMKIDIHTHTKRCKSGDAPTRQISPEDFCETILSTEVRIIAITNHNVFDLDQFEKIEAGLGKDAQVWPGIELDVFDGGSRGHLLVIVSPRSAKTFSAAVLELTKNSSPDTFTATIEEVLKAFDALNPLYVAHYKQKKPNLTDEVLEILEKKTKNPGCVIKEVTNSISAGIYISHGHSSIYGSDIHDWVKYEELSSDLPDLRLPVDSFEHFCLLLKKDSTTINTVLDRKTSEDLVLLPFGDSANLKIKAFNDINVVFGPKGTGKSCILKAIAKHYAENGVDARVYESASDRIEDIFDIKGRDLTINLDTFGINYCSDEIEALRSAGEVAVTALSKYVGYFAAKNTNRNAKKILLKDIEPAEESSIKREFIEFTEAAKTTAVFLEFLTNNSSVEKELDDEEVTEVTRILSGLLERLRKREWNSFSDWKEICLVNSAIKVFRREVERKTGMPAKPTTTGFRDYAMNRVLIEVNVAEIVKSVDTAIPMQTNVVGSLGSNKGNLQFLTEFQFQNGDITDGALSSLTVVKKTPQKKFVNCLRMVLKHVYADDLFQYISELNEIEDVEGIKTVFELLLFKRYFALDGQPYSPSSGESAMVMLQKELGADKEVYLLDEPERSLGNEYINDVIVPLIKERARAGKKVFISTHDANIAVRTLPYSSVYRCHGPAGYSTYIGNPFTNNLVNLNDAGDQLDWKKVSMRTLEGGEEAFGERGRIYGNN
jgi:ABC-type cobalamin/Fe3+-siderophores transport system ATPase subunit